MGAFRLVCVEEDGCLPLRVKRICISFRYPDAVFSQLGFIYLCIETYIYRETKCIYIYTSIE